MNKIDNHHKEWLRKETENTPTNTGDKKSYRVLKEASNHKPFYDNKFENLD